MSAEEVLLPEAVTFFLFYKPPWDWHFAVAGLSSCLLTPASQIGVPLPIQLPAKALWEAEENDPSAWTLDARETRMEFLTAGFGFAEAWLFGE